MTYTYSIVNNTALKQVSKATLVYTANILKHMLDITCTYDIVHVPWQLNPSHCILNRIVKDQYVKIYKYRSPNMLSVTCTCTYM